MTSAADDDDLQAVLASACLLHLETAVAGESLRSAAQALADNRPLQLKCFQERGVAKLSERQKLANAIAKGARERGLDIVAAPKPVRLALPDAPVPLHGRRGLTITGKTDGFGAQLQAQMSGIAFAHRHGKQYVHTPMGPKMDFELHGGAETSAACMDAFGGMAAWSTRMEDVEEPSRRFVEAREFVAEVHNASSAELGAYYSEEVRGLLRDKYEVSPKPELPECCGDGASYVALHVRRGDVTAEAHPRRHTPNATLDAVVIALASRHPNVPIVVFSQGGPAEFDSLLAAAPTADVRLCLDADVRQTFQALVAAPFLFVAKSSFSYSAALLSRGVVYADLLEEWWHQPLPCWNRLYYNSGNMSGNRRRGVGAE